MKNWFWLLAAVVLLTTVNSAIADLMQAADTGDTAQTYINYDNIRAQGREFTANSTYVLRNISVLLGPHDGAATPDCGLYVSIWTGDGDKPTTKLAHFGTMPNTALVASAWNTVNNATGYNVTSGTTYWLVWEATNSCPSNYPTVRYKGGGSGLAEAANANNALVWSTTGFNTVYTGMWRLYNDTPVPNVQVDSPPNNDHSRDSPVQFKYNLSTVTGANCTLYLNGTANTTSLNLPTGNLYSLNVTFPAGTNTYSWLISCTDSYGTTNTTSRTYYHDTVNPSITYNANNFFSHDNTTKIRKSTTPTLQFNLTLDDTYLYSHVITITNPAGAYVFNYTRTGLTTATESITNTTSTTAWTQGTYTNINDVEDDHTAQTIPDYATSKDLAAGELLYDTDKGTHLTIKLKDATSNLVNLSTRKLPDRYTFDYDFDSDGVTPQTYVFKLSSSHPIDYRGSLYPYPSFVSHHQWIDFQLITDKPVTYEQVKYVPQSNTYEVRITTPENHLRFNSLGGLNRQTETSTFYVNLSATQTENLTVTAINPTNITLTWDIPSDANGTTLYRNNTIVYNGSLETYTDTGLTGMTSYVYRSETYRIDNNVNYYNYDVSAENRVYANTTNAAPVPTANITPASLTSNTTMQLHCTATDPDSTNVSFNYILYQNGTVNRTGTTAGFVPGTDVNFLNISGLRANQNYTLSCQANDSQATSNYTNTTSRVVGYVVSNYTANEDTYITQDNPNANYSSTTSIEIMLDEYRILVKYPISAMSNYASIVDAKACLYVRQNDLDTATEGMTISAHHLYPNYLFNGVEWNELNPTWTLRPNTTQYNQTAENLTEWIGGAGEDIEEYVCWNVTKMLIKEHTDGHNNLSVLFIPTTYLQTATGDVIGFNSLEATGNYPYLQVTYDITENRPPTIDTPTITPSTAYMNDTLIGTCPATDLDGDTLTYNHQWYVNGTPNATTQNVSGNIRPLLNYTYSCQANDSQATSAWTNSTVKTITSRTPVITSAEISPSPAQLGQNLTYDLTCTDDDTGDTCNQTVYCTWYKNGVSTSTACILASGNFTTGDNITLSVGVADQWGTRSADTNTSTMTIGDATPPTVNLSLSSSSVTVGTVVTMTATCTDANTITEAIIQITDPNTATTNYTMTGTNPYNYNYTTGTPTGTYTVKAYCTDGSTNTGNSTATNLVVTAADTGGGGGSGGGGGDTIYLSEGDFGFASPLIDKGVMLDWDFKNQPTTFNVTVPLTKTAKTCTAEPPFTCKITPDGTSAVITYTENDNDYFTKVLTGKITATSTAGEVATTTAQFRLLNLGYSTLGSSNWQPPGIFTTYPYILNVVNGQYAGVRIVFLAGLLTISLGILYWTSRTPKEKT